MGQKIHPTGFRLSVNKNWSARWFANCKNYSRLLLEDIRVREYLTKKLSHASLGHIRIERPAKNARVTLYSARPGMIIGKKGEDIEVLRTALQKISGVPVQVNIEDIRKPELNAQLIAASIAHQLERRIMFRRAMKRAMQNAMRLGGLGIKIMSAGRLNGAEIARTEWYREGRVPLHTLRADIEYGFAEAKTTYGVIGVKVWVYKGEAQQTGEQALPAAAEPTTAAELSRQEFVQSVMGAETMTVDAAAKTVRRKTTTPAVNAPEGERRIELKKEEAPRARRASTNRPTGAAGTGDKAPSDKPMKPRRPATAVKPTASPKGGKSASPTAAKPASVGTAKPKTAKKPTSKDS